MGGIPVSRSSFSHTPCSLGRICTALGSARKLWVTQLVASGSTDLPVKKKNILLVLSSWAMHLRSVFLFSRHRWASQKPISCGLRRSFRVRQTRDHTCCIHQRGRQGQKSHLQKVKDWMHWKSWRLGLADDNLRSGREQPVTSAPGQDTNTRKFFLK